VGVVWEGVPTNNYGEYYLLIWRLPSPNDVSSKITDKSGMPLANSEIGPLKELGEGENMIKASQLPYAPWKKEEEDEFEDLVEADIPKKRTELADKALISAVKTIIEIERDSGLLAY
jgi:hypothetical protein